MVSICKGKLETGGRSQGEGEAGNKREKMRWKENVEKGSWAERGEKSVSGMGRGGTIVFVSSFPFWDSQLPTQICC